MKVGKSLFDLNRRLHYSKISKTRRERQKQIFPLGGVFVGGSSRESFVIYHATQSQSQCSHLTPCNKFISSRKFYMTESQWVLWVLRCKSCVMSLKNVEETRKYKEIFPVLLVNFPRDCQLTNKSAN